MKEIYDMSRQLFKAFSENDIVLLEMALKQVNLEDVFIELTEDTAPENAEASEETEHEAPVTSEATQEKTEEGEVESDDSSTEA